MFCGRGGPSVAELRVRKSSECGTRTRKSFEGWAEGAGVLGVGTEDSLVLRELGCCFMGAGRRAD